MDLRDQIAIEVMKSELAKYDFGCHAADANQLAKFCYQIAEAMLDERVRGMH